MVMGSACIRVPRASNSLSPVQNIIIGIEIDTQRSTDTMGLWKIDGMASDAVKIDVSLCQNWHSSMEDRVDIVPLQCLLLLLCLHTQETATS